MSFPFKSWDLLYISLLTFYILFKVLQWSDYQECFAPIHLFLISARCILLFLVISLAFLKNPTLSSRSKSFINILLYVILNPFCIYLAVQGFIWQMKNMTKTPDCIPNISHDISVFVWIGGVVCVAGTLSYINILKAYKYWKVIQFRRRWSRINLNGTPEEINEFLYGIPTEISQKTGLETSDIEKLPVNGYSLSLQNVLKANHSETCPICFEDYKDGDALTALPKCEHRFHPQCINGWLVKSPLCPLCRGNVRNNLYMETIEQAV